MVRVFVTLLFTSSVNSATLHTPDAVLAIMLTVLYVRCRYLENK